MVSVSHIQPEIAEREDIDYLVRQARCIDNADWVVSPPYRHIRDLLVSLQQGDLEQDALTYYKQGKRIATFNYAEFLASISSAQAFLAKHYRIEPGQRVAIFSFNSPEFIIAALALMSMNAIVVPLNPGESESNLQYIIAQSGTSLLLYADELTQELNLISDEGMVLPSVSLQALLQQQELVELEVASVGGDETIPAVLLYTSGTTGHPKGVLLSHDALLLNAFGLKLNFNISSETKHLCVLPLFHANAWGFSMLASLVGRAHLVLCDKFQLLSFWKVIDDEEINLTSLTPVLLKMLAPRAGDKVRSNLQVVSAAAPLKKDVAREFIDAAGIRIHQGYGLSECTNFATIMPPDIPEQDFRYLMYYFPETCIGSAIFGSEVKVVNAKGEKSAPGEEGQLVVRGLNNMLGYWQEPDKTAQAYAGEWLNTGDQGYYIHLKGRDYFFISGRLKEIIIRLGENISPANVEAQLHFLNALGECVVVGFENNHTDEEVGLWIEPTTHLVKSVLIEELIKVTITRKLPFFQQPKVVIIGSLKQTRTSVGKIKRAALAKQFAAYRNEHFHPVGALLVSWV